MAMIPARSDTKQRLIETALELLWKNSYGSVSVDDICKAADVKKGSFYHFFPSKADLAIEVMEETYRGTKAVYDQIFSAEKPPLARFEDFADYVCEKQSEIAARFKHVCGCPLASLGSEMAGQEQGIQAKYDEVNRRRVRYFENALRDMIADGLIHDSTDVTSKAQEISAYVLGQLMLARIQNDLQTLKRDLKPGLLQMLGLTGKT